tara:strand:- start:1634 stop:2140 length:507 start_codon:yes stop_codon:yes gene_type:complete
MASTSTNKQPLLVDHVLHEIVDLVGATVEPDTVIDVGGSNGAALLVDCTTNDGAIIAEIYSTARTVASAYTINLYISNANDFLRPSQAKFIGTFNGATTAGVRTVWTGMPFLLNPVPHVGATGGEVVGTQFQGLYIPKGRALWAAVRKATATDATAAAPLVAAHGGYY